MPLSLGRDNAVGFIRLILAVFVIISHTPEIRDGNQSREILTYLTAQITLGGVAVRLFFVISGYLITASYFNSVDSYDYLRKRLIRIYPGFIVAMLISLLFVVPAIGVLTSISHLKLAKNFSNILLLQNLDLSNIPLGIAINDVNGSIWTIAYEFRCYIFILLLGNLGLLRKASVITVLAGLMMATFVYYSRSNLENVGSTLPFRRILFGRIDVSLELTSVFLIGAIAYLYRDRIVSNKWIVLCSAIGLPISLRFESWAPLGIAVFGGYLVLVLAVSGKDTIFATINQKTDISFGTYLYGWPVISLIIYLCPNMPIYSIAGIAIILSMAAGWLSWHFVESPAIRFSARRG